MTSIPGQRRDRGIVPATRSRQYPPLQEEYLTQHRAPVAARDLARAADLCHEFLSGFLKRDWSVRAGTLDWDARETLTHVVAALRGYAMHLERRMLIPMPVPPLPQENSAAQLVDLVRLAATELAGVAERAPAGTLAFHAAGASDAEGFLAMGCDELLVHTYDIACGFDGSFAPPSDLCRKVLARLFPWATVQGDPWDVLLYENGRASPAGPRRDESEWVWYSPPLASWDGERGRKWPLDG